jgi:Glycosyltransferase sugar-binding region containing DXD motif
MMLRNKSHASGVEDIIINSHTPQQQKRQSPSSTGRITVFPFPFTRRVPPCCRNIAKKYRIIGIIVAVPAFFFTYSYFYSWLNTTDPCLVANLYSPEKIVQLQPRGINDFYAAPLSKVVHQQWKTSEIPKGKYTEWRQAWLDLYPAPEYQHILWTDESMRQLIATQYPRFLNIYDAYPYNIQRADVARYFILHYHGGLYADLDYEPLVNFWHRLPSDRVSLVESPYKYNEQHQNSLMASPRGDRFWNAVFGALVQEGSSLSSSSVFAKTGPQFLDRVARRKEVGAQPFYTLPCENFHRVPFVQQPGKESPWITRLGHHTLARFYPMKYCGDFSQIDDSSSSSSSCQYGKHHNAVSYLQETGGLM